MPNHTIFVRTSLGCLLLLVETRHSLGLSFKEFHLGGSSFNVPVSDNTDTSHPSRKSLELTWFVYLDLHHRLLGLPALIAYLKIDSSLYRHVIQKVIYRSNSVARFFFRNLFHIKDEVLSHVRRK